MGKHMMAISVVNAMLLGVALAATIGRNYPGRRIITATTMASFATVLWWRVGMLLRAQKRDREDSQREVNNG
jgi:ABC-type Mn2+/Zn2+ transport system permease subunit